MDKNILYDDLVLTITNILKKKNLDNKLKPYIYYEDKKILHNFFLKPILEFNNNKLNIEWDDNKWIESMKFIRLGLLSFLYKNNATLYKIYEMVKDDEIDSLILLEKYKNLVYNFIMIEKISQANKYLYEENVLLDELQQKNYYLLLNIKNITDSKYISCLLDLLSYKEYRKNILNYIFNGVEKLDLNILTDIVEKNNYDFIEIFLDNLEKNNIYNKIINFIMLIKMDGEILIKKEINNKVQIYINEIINNSNVLTTYFNKIQNDFNQNKNHTKFKNEIKILSLPENITFTSKRSMNKSNIKNYKDMYNNKKHIDLYNVDYDKIYSDVFIEGKEYYFSKKDIIQRINNIICLLIEYISINYIRSKDEKINIVNNFFSNNKIFEKFNIDLNNKKEFQDILKNIKENGLLKNIISEDDKEYNNKEILNEILEEIKEKLKKHQDSQHFYNIIVEFFYILHNIDLLDISSIKKEDFNICFDLVKKITEDLDKFKCFIFNIIEKENFNLILSFIEKKNILKINKVIKEKIVEIFLKTLLEIVNILKIDDEEKNKSFIKFLYIVSKGFDHAIFYLIKLKHSKKFINDKTHVKKQVVFR